MAGPSPSFPVSPHSSFPTPTLPLSVPTDSELEGEAWSRELSLREPVCEGHTAGDVARCFRDPKEKLLVTQDPELWDSRDQRQVKYFQMGEGVVVIEQVRDTRPGVGG